MTATIRGISHVALSVPAVAPAREALVDVLDFEVFTDTDEYSLLIHRAGEFAVALTDHGGMVAGPFDERHPGLDHLSFAVAPADLVALRDRIAGAGLIVDAIVDGEAGQHLNFRLPGGVPIELFAMNEAFRNELGLEPVSALSALSAVGSATPAQAG